MSDLIGRKRRLRFKIKITCGTCGCKVGRGKHQCRDPLACFEAA